jgi:prepilin-type N-terminal cleavage/methylation domain-containing protein
MAVRSPAGFSLIEVMIALVVMTVGMLGLSALHVESLRLSRSTIYRNTAIALARDMAERLRAGSDGEATDTEQVGWAQEVRKQLPDGSTTDIRPLRSTDNGLAHGTSVKRYEIELQWPEPGQDTPARYTLTVDLAAE